MDPDPREAIEWKEKGDLAFKKKDYDAAASMYVAALAYDEKNYILQGNLSLALYKMCAYKEAVYAAQAALDINPNWAKGHARLALALKGLSNYAPAITAYQRAIALEPNNKEWKDGLTALHQTIQDRLKDPDAVIGFTNESLSRTFNENFMELVWDANDWWYKPTTLDNPRHTFQEQWDFVEHMKRMPVPIKPIRYADMGFSKDICILRGRSILMHPSNQKVKPDKDPFYKHAELNGAVPDVILFAPDISIHLNITMITDEAERRRYHEVTFYMTEENCAMGETMRKQRLKWQEELLQRAWKEAMRIEELHPLTLILYYALHVRYYNKASQEKHMSLCKDFISICEKMKIDGFRGLLEARQEYCEILLKRLSKSGTEELRRQWISMCKFNGKARHKHEQRYFSIAKTGAFENLAILQQNKDQFDEAWELFQKAFKEAITNDLNICVEKVLKYIYMLFVIREWRTEDWRFREATNFLKTARSTYPTFPNVYNVPAEGGFWTKVIEACRRPDEERVFFGHGQPYQFPTAEIPKKLAVDHMCMYCQKQTAKSLCSGCKNVWYCNKECQKAAWSVHKSMCKNIQLKVKNP